jgi:hypothetical protein
VLIAGGETQTGAPEATCEIYDPDADGGTWTSTGSLSQARSFASAT